MQYGYIRVSSREQNIDRQADAFGAYRLDKILSISSRARILTARHIDR